MVDIYKYKIANEKAEVLYDVMAGIDQIVGSISGQLVTLVTTLPSTGYDAQLVYNMTDKKLYIYANAQWNAITSTTTSGGETTVVPTIPNLDTLPSDNTDGNAVVVDGTLHIWDDVSGSWIEVGGSTNPVGDSVFINETPANPEIGDTVIDLIGGTVQTYNGTTWDVESYTPEASAITKIGFVDALPATAEDGTTLYNRTDGQTYVMVDGAWKNLGEAITSTASSANGISIVSELPATVTNGAVIYNSTDKKLYEGINGVWTQVVEPTTAAAEVADGSLTTAAFASGLTPIEIVGTLPTTNNFLGRVALLTTNGKIYRYTASGWTTGVAAIDLTGQINGTQIGANAITTEHIMANSITGNMIQANSITAAMLTADALTVGTVSAGAITATELASGAVTTDKLYAGAVTATKIASNSIDATKIIAGSISGDRIAANAINAGHIQAGAVTASEISAGAISADKIATNAITSTKISAGAVGATQISANAITADKIATGAITSTKITAGAITADKLDVNALIGKRVQMDSTSAYSTQYFTDSVFGSQSTAFSFKNTNRTYGIACEKTNSGNGSAIYGLCSSSAQTGAAVVGINQSSSLYSWAGFFSHKTSTAISATTGNASGQWGYWSSAKSYSGGGFSPFTGSHIVYSPENLVQGELVYSDDAWVVNIDNSLVHVKKTNTPKDKRVIGVVSFVQDDIMRNIEINSDISDKISNTEYRVKPQFKPYVDYMLNNNFKEVEINSVGEGSILVSSKNGNIENGDYLTSDGYGYAMKQDDDILHNYTVAKALESVDWSQESSTTKMIACTYHCG